MAFKIKMLVAAAAAGAAFAATPSAAATYINCTTPSNPTTCTFGNDDPPTGEFVDTFAFVLPYAKVLTGSLTNLYQNINQNVNFPSGNNPRISGGTLASPVTFTTTATPNPDTRSIGPITLGAGSYEIRVRGFAQPEGTYAGTLNFGAVPEPATWAFMILGFGLIGGALRRRKATVRMAYA